MDRKDSRIILAEDEDEITTEPVADEFENNSNENG